MNNFVGIFLTIHLLVVIRTHNTISISVFVFSFFGLFHFTSHKIGWSICRSFDVGFIRSPLGEWECVVLMNIFLERTADIHRYVRMCVWVFCLFSFLHLRFWFFLLISFCFLLFFFYLAVLIIIHHHSFYLFVVVYVICLKRKKMSSWIKYFFLML